MSKLIELFKDLSSIVEFTKILMWVALMALLARLGWVMAFGLSADISGYSAAAGALLAAIAVVYIADRQMIYEAMKRKADAELADAQGMHEMIFLAKDLRGYLGYLQKTLLEGGHKSVYGMHENIRDRFMKMTDARFFKWMPGDLVDKIAGLSPYIYGVCTLLIMAERISQNSDNSAAMKSVETASEIDPVTDHIQEIIDYVSRLRTELRD